MTKCSACGNGYIKKPIYHEGKVFHKTCHEKASRKSRNNAPNYINNNRCTRCGEWKPKDIFKCDECKNPLRTGPRYNRGIKKVVARI